MKSDVVSVIDDICSRSREGAWIEIGQILIDAQVAVVAPVRERGLKCKRASIFCMEFSRSREGAWIEIVLELASSSRVKRSLP